MLNDLDQIRKLVSDLAWYIDTGETEMGLAQFAEGACLDATGAGGGLLDTEAGIREFMEGSYERAPQRLHLMSNHVVDIDGDRASGRCCGLAYTKAANGSMATVGIAYEDSYVRERTQWKIARRKVRLMVYPG